LALGLTRAAVGLPPLRVSPADAVAYRQGHPLKTSLIVCADLLGDAVREAGCVFALADAGGVVLWVHGDTRARQWLGRLHLTEGADWSEPAAGTNPIGTALALGEPVRLVGADHFSPLLVPLAGSAAPIRHPLTGVTLGVLCLAGPTPAGSLQTLALTRATARVAEADLAELAAEAGPAAVTAPHRPRLAAPPAPAPPAPLTLSVLGRVHALLDVDGRVHELTPRHSEIVTLLSLAPEGLTAEALARGLTGDGISPTTVRVEMSRLRRQVGDDLFTARPYSLRRPVRSDADALADLLALGRAAEAFDRYPGPPLPNSAAPAIRDLGRDLAEKLRQEVLASYDARLVRRWLATEAGETDAAAWDTYAGLLPVGSPRREEATARAAALRPPAGEAPG
jgi:hypothetical protein